MTTEPTTRASKATQAMVLAATLAWTALAACGPGPQAEGAVGLSYAERELVAWLQASQRAGFERHDLPAYLAAFAPEATLTVARGPDPGPYDRSIDFATIAATRAERFHGPVAQPSRLWWSEVTASIDGDRATVRWVAHSETPGAGERVAEVYHLRRARHGERGPFRVVENRLWPLWQIDGRRLPIAFDAATWAHRDAEVLRHRCDGGPCPDVLLAAWRFEEAWQAAVALTERTTRDHPQAAVRWMVRGVCAVVSGRVADAEPSFVEALRIDPDVRLPNWRSAEAARRR